MMSRDAAGWGIARHMCEQAPAHARSREYRAMQLNVGVITNAWAVRLRQNLGFEIIGRPPRAFHHSTRGDVDALVMFWTL